MQINKFRVTKHSLVAKPSKLYPNVTEIIKSEIYRVILVQFLENVACKDC